MLKKFGAQAEAPIARHSDVPISAKATCVGERGIIGKQVIRHLAAENRELKSYGSSEQRLHDGN